MYYNQAEREGENCFLEVWDRSHVCAASLEFSRRGKTAALQEFLNLQSYIIHSYSSVSLAIIMAPAKSTRVHHLEELHAAGPKRGGPFEYDPHPGVSYTAEIENRLKEHDFYTFQAQLMARALNWTSVHHEIAYTPCETWNSYHAIRNISVAYEDIYPGLAVGSPCECGGTV